MKSTNISYDFLQSALTLENPHIKTTDILHWLEEVGKQYHHKIELISFKEFNEWTFDKISGNLAHHSGRFFSIDGIKVRTNWGNVPCWSQPIINQPEIGFLGIIAKRFNGILYFLMQAKAEPGNINGVQISPTLQATKSNYTRVHKGAAPKYLEYFSNSQKTEKTTVLLDQLQSEQGARFWKKRNRNIIIEVTEDLDVHPEFCWLSLGQIKWLLGFDNIINMDTRTVVSGIPFFAHPNLLASHSISQDGISMLQSETEGSKALFTTDHLISWITNIKFKTTLEVEPISLRSLKHWERTDKEIRHIHGKYFSVVAARVSLGNREVNQWEQPLIKSAQEGIIAFIVKKINGVYHFLVQAKLECGNFDLVELAPTVQCLTGNYRKGQSDYEVKFLDLVLNPSSVSGRVIYSAYQSEEGGRFYLEQNKNIIIEVGESFENTETDRFIWMTMEQLKTFVRFNNYLNIQARSLLSVVNYL